VAQALAVTLIVVGGVAIAAGGLLSRSSRVDDRGDPTTVWRSAPFSADVRRWAASILLGAAGVVVGLGVWALLQTSLLFGLAIVTALGVAGFLAPRVRAERAERRRLAEGNHLVSSFAGLLSVELRSGLGVDAALENVANELDGVLSDEMQRATLQVRLGMPRGRALGLLRERLPAPNVERLVQVLQHAGELGAPVAQTLDDLAADCTLRRYQEVREEAAKLPVKLLFPVLFCIFPPMLLVLAGPALVRIAEALG
jgi:tight adherence protein C